MDEQEINNPSSKKFWLIGLIVVTILVGIGAGYYFFIDNKDQEDSQEATAKVEDESKSEVSKAWKEGGVAIAGKYADAEVIELDNGKYRMYYSIEPEVPGNKLEMFSALSSDGISWTNEVGVRKTFAVFPDIIELPDGRFRVYFQNERVIKSAISSDGLNFTDESGIRIDKPEQGYEIDAIGANSTYQMDDSSYLMVYSGTKENTRYDDEVPNNKIANLFYATSLDGLTWQKKGLAVSSDNTILKGWSDGAELVNFDGELRLYFWSYMGVYYTVFKDGAFSDNIIFDFTNNTDSSRVYPQNPPGDPTLIKIQNKWYMYYGQHEKGIYYATYE